MSSELKIDLPVNRVAVAAGLGGNIQISAEAVMVQNGGAISTSTLGSGAAGSLKINARQISIDASKAGVNTGIFATAEKGSTGRSGAITLKASEFNAQGSLDSRITSGVIARSLTAARAGDIVLRSNNVLVENKATVTSANTAGGGAGSVLVQAGDAIVLRRGSSVTAVSQEANAGTISLQAGRRIELRDGSTVTAAAGANGGSVSLVARDLVTVDHSSITATAGRSLPAGAAANVAGAGGNIFIDPTYVIFDHASISANAAAGLGGNILLQAENFLSSSSLLTANGETAGVVQVDAPELDLVAGLVALPGSVIDVSTQLRDQCARRLNLDFSSFLSLGRGGVEDSPGEPRAETSPDLPR